MPFQSIDQAFDFSHTHFKSFVVFIIQTQYRFEFSRSRDLITHFDYSFHSLFVIIFKQNHVSIIVVGGRHFVMSNIRSLSLTTTILHTSASTIDDFTVWILFELWSLLIFAFNQIPMVYLFWLITSFVLCFIASYKHTYLTVITVRSRMVQSQPSSLSAKPVYCSRPVLLPLFYLSFTS